MNKTETSAAMKAEKADMYIKQLADSKQKIQGLEAQVLELKSKYMSIQSSRANKDKEYKSREARLHKSAQMLKAFEDEVFRKDSIIIQKEKIVVKQESQI